MFDLDKWQEIFHTLKQNKLRTFLTAFGVFWGILMLILLLGAGTGMRHGAEKMFSSDVRDSIWIFGRQTSLPYKGLAPNRKVQFTEADIAAIKRQLPGVKYVSAENPLGSFFAGNTIVTHHEKSGNFSMFGVAENYFKIKVYQDYHFGRRDSIPMTARRTARSPRLARGLRKSCFHREKTPPGNTSPSMGSASGWLGCSMIRVGKAVCLSAFIFRWRPFKKPLAAVKISA
jgi:putative ABC transport system permease protein